jgi:hypothetical protein
MQHPFEVIRLPVFERDLKRLTKKFRTLPEDLDVFLDAAILLKHLHQPDWPGIVRIDGLGCEEPAFYKARRFACQSLKGTAGNSGIRVIYRWESSPMRVTLIEIYYKGEKESEDRVRLRKLA